MAAAAELLDAAATGNLRRLRQIVENYQSIEEFRRICETSIDITGKTVLHMSICAGSSDCLNLLLEAGADPNVMSCGMTPLAHVVAEWKNEFLKILLKAGADLNLVGMSDLTPLEYAAISNNYEGAAILFPVASRLTFVPNWSLDGTMAYVRSEEAMHQRELKNKENFQLAKEQGAAAVQRRDYMSAMLYCTQAIGLNPNDAKVRSNRSLCWANLNDGNRALSDAEACVKLSPDWPKAHYREGAAWMLLKNYSCASEAFSQAKRLDLENKEIQKAFKEAVEAEFGFEVSDNIRAFHINI